MPNTSCRNCGDTNTTRRMFCWDCLPINHGDDPSEYNRIYRVLYKETENNKTGKCKDCGCQIRRQWLRCSRCSDARKAATAARVAARKGHWVRARDCPLLKEVRHATRVAHVVCSQCGRREWLVAQHPSRRTCTRCNTKRARKRRRQGRRRDQLWSPEWMAARQQVLDTETHCGWCHQPVDKNINGTHPQGPQVDHIVPRHAAPQLTLDRSNLQLVHHECNIEKAQADRDRWPTRVEKQRRTAPTAPVKRLRRDRRRKAQYIAAAKLAAPRKF